MHYKHFARDDRVKLSVLLKAGVSKPKISEILGRNPSSIRREIKRNSKGGIYLPFVAKKEARKRKAHRERKIENDSWFDSRI